MAGHSGQVSRCIHRTASIQLIQLASRDSTLFLNDSQRILSELTVFIKTRQLRHSMIEQFAVNDETSKSRRLDSMTAPVIASLNSLWYFSVESRKRTLLVASITNIGESERRIDSVTELSRTNG